MTAVLLQRDAIAVEEARNSVPIEFQRMLVTSILLPGPRRDEDIQ
jgi:hypothetical protein